VTDAVAAERPRRKRGWGRWIWRFLFVLAALIVIACAAFYIWQQGSLPKTSGEVRVEGLTADVTIARDADGLVTVKASNETDGAFAIGYAHAQDRLFQMDAMRRLAAGRLSEVIGERTLQIDKAMRALGLYRLAEENLQGLSDQTKAILQAYADGVNAFIATHEGPWTFEFYLLGFEPEPWRPADSIAWGRLMALQLSGNYRDELLNARIAGLVEEAAAKQLYPDWPDWAPSGVADYRDLERQGVLQGLEELFPWEIGPKGASNAWALSPARSTTGGALLAGDPHLGLMMPGNWYLARIETPEFTVAGATAPGVPYVVMGHNGHIAWSFTTTYSDTQDLFVETPDPARPETHYLTAEGPRPFDIREETIEISGQEPLNLTVRSTYHGPVMSDVVEEAADLFPDDKVVALAWTALSSQDRSGEALYRLTKSRDIAEATAALRDLHSPQQTMILADRQGDIALLAPGSVPIRKAGNGLMPVPGESGAYDWVGRIPYPALPKAVSPDSGQVLTANNRLVGDDYPYLIAARWEFPDRAARIAAMLGEQARFSPEDLRLQQLDVVSNGAQRLLPRLLLAPLPEEASAALSRLEAWDYRMTVDAAAPLIYSAWLWALERVLMEDQLGEALPSLLQGSAFRVERLLKPDSLWCDNVATEPTESCDQAIATALERALRALVDEYGEDVSDWRWGEAHYARLNHPILGFIPVLGSLTAIEVEAPGGQDTVNRAGSSFREPIPRAFLDRHGPGFRGVYDLSNLDDAGFIIASGQSGNIFSPYFGNLVERWRDGVLLRLDGSDGGTGETLTLRAQ